MKSKILIVGRFFKNNAKSNLFQFVIWSQNVRFLKLFFCLIFERKWDPCGYLEPNFKIFRTFVCLYFQKEMGFAAKI